MKEHSLKTPEELRALHGEAYVAKFQRAQWAERLKNVLARIALDTEMRVADFACGDGMLLEHMAHRVRHYTGVDFSPPFIAEARKRQERLAISNADFFCSSIEEFAVEHPAKFDAGFALDFSEHVYDHHWRPILAAIRACLRPGGRFFLHTPNASFIPELLKSRNLLLRQFPEHIAVRTREHNTALVNQAGFRIVRADLIPHYNVLRLIHPLSHVPFLGRYFGARVFIEATVD